MTRMSRARVARRIAAGAAYGGGGVGLVGAAAVGLVLAEVRFVKRHVGNGHGPGSNHVPSADGRYGHSYDTPGEPPLRLTMLGDSTAAGQGVHRAAQTPGALLASGLAAVAERPVELHNVALPGAQSDDLDRQVALALADTTRVPDICVIMIGANDVTHRMHPTRSVRHLSATVRRLRTAGAEVVVGTCPDLGTVEQVQQPLRWLARRASRQLAAAQTIGTVEQGGRTVSLGDLLGPEFAANPRELFGPDNFHPPRRATPRRPWRSSRPSAPRWASGRPTRTARTRPAARASCRWHGRPRRPPRSRARRSRRRCRRVPGVRGPC